MGEIADGKEIDNMESYKEPDEYYIFTSGFPQGSRRILWAVNWTDRFYQPRVDNAMLKTMGSKMKQIFWMLALHLSKVGVKILNIIFASHGG